MFIECHETSNTVTLKFILPTLPHCNINTFYRPACSVMLCASDQLLLIGHRVAYYLLHVYIHWSLQFDFVMVTVRSIDLTKLQIIVMTMIIH